MYCYKDTQNSKQQLSKMDGVLKTYFLKTCKNRAMRPKIVDFSTYNLLRLPYFTLFTIQLVIYVIKLSVSPEFFTIERLFPIQWLLQGVRGQSVLFNWVYLVVINIKGLILIMSYDLVRAQQVNFNCKDKTKTEMNFWFFKLTMLSCILATDYWSSYSHS